MGFFSRDPDIEQHLREALEVARQLGEHALLAAHDGEHLERGDQAVARGVVVEEEDVARLLAAQVVAAAAHGLDHVAVADLRAHQAEPQALERPLEAEVAHHRRHDLAAGERVARHQVVRAQREHHVAVEDLAPAR